jgi:transposase
VPHLAGLAIDELERVDGLVVIRAHARGRTARCPGCRRWSKRIHSRYERTLADTAVGGQPVAIQLRVRRFVCPRTSCSRRTFVEQVDGLTLRYGRHSVLLRRLLETIGLALAGRAGARMTMRLAVPVSRMTLLRLVRALPEHVPKQIREIGIDDFAFRRGHVYGTIVIDMANHHPVDVLPDRTSETVQAWLKEHPGVQIVCRDRAGAYAEAVRLAAPDATQVADRWHLWHNLTQAVEKTVASHRAELHDDESDHDNDDTGAETLVEQAVRCTEAEPVAQDEGGLVARTRERHAAVQGLHQQGMTVTAIGRRLGLSRKTVRRFTQAENVEDLLGKARSRESLLDPFKPYLHERFNAGHTDAAALTTQITAMGYRGSDKTVRRYLQPFRATQVAPRAAPVPPSVRQVTGWLTRRPRSLSEEEALELKKVLVRSAVLAATSEQVRDFAVILTERRGHEITEWIENVEATGATALRSFAAGLRNDLKAVTAGLSMEYNSGPVEGQVNRIKMIKRQMFGRAKFDLLRKRILNPA